jgi:hypothetical protein
MMSPRTAVVDVVPTKAGHASAETTSKLAVIIALGVGVMSFFLPCISLNAPIVGSVKWSAFNIISQFSDSSSTTQSPSFGDLSKNLNKEVVSKDEAEVPLGIKLAPFIPVEVAFTYLLIVVVATTLFIPHSRKILIVTSVIGSATSGLALISVFLFGDALRQNMMKAMSGPDMQGNPFAGIGQALMQSFRVDPEIALYLLVAIMAALLVLAYLPWFKASSA